MTADLLQHLLCQPCSNFAEASPDPCQAVCIILPAGKHLSRVKVGLSVGMAILGVIIAILLGVWITRRHKGYASMTTVRANTTNLQSVFRLGQMLLET